MCMLVGCQTSQAKQAETAQAGLATQQAGVSKQAASAAGAPLSQALSSATGAQSFFSQLLSGDKTAIMNAIAPGIQTLTGQYNTLAKQTKNLLPSGGERNKLLADLPFQKAGDIATLVGGAQKEGAQGLLQVSQLLGGQGTSLLGGSTAAAGTGGAIESNIVSQEQQQQQQQQQAGQGIGSLIALLAGL